MPRTNFLRKPPFPSYQDFINLSKSERQNTLLQCAPLPSPTSLALPCPGLFEQPHKGLVPRMWAPIPTPHPNAILSYRYLDCVSRSLLRDPNQAENVYFYIDEEEDPENFTCRELGPEEVAYYSRKPGLYLFKCCCGLFYIGKFSEHSAIKRFLLNSCKFAVGEKSCGSVYDHLLVQGHHIVPGSFEVLGYFKNLDECEEGKALFRNEIHHISLCYREHRTSHGLSEPAINWLHSYFLRKHDITAESTVRVWDARRTKNGVKPATYTTQAYENYMSLTLHEAQDYQNWYAEQSGYNQ